MKQVYEDRKEILQMFNNVSVFRDERTQTAFLYTYNNGKKNEYFFDLKDNHCSFFRDSVLFNPDSVLLIDKERNPSYRKQIAVKAEFYLKKMDSLGIKEISSEFIPQGITLKIYMKSKAVLVYVANPNAVKNQEWINYLGSMKKFDDHWYYAKQDQ
jgi:hypothetical protein